MLPPGIMKKMEKKLQFLIRNLCISLSTPELMHNVEMVWKNQFKKNLAKTYKYVSWQKCKFFSWESLKDPENHIYYTMKTLQPC